MTSKPTAIVVGAGIIGLATARALAVRGYDVKVIERNQRAIGASIRNFGMVWPVGQPDGALYERALLSRSIWMETCRQAGLWFDTAGSLHLAHHPDEWNVLQELAATYRQRGYRLLDAASTIKQSAFVNSQGLLGALYSDQELVVDPRKAIHGIADLLRETHQVAFHYGHAVTDIAYPSVSTGVEEWEADEIYVCSGADFETLYPQLYSSLPITKCKLQMMRLPSPAGNSRIGPAMCGALSLSHYTSFKAAHSLAPLLTRYRHELKDHLDLGIHVMVSQNQEGQLTIGDSHEYGLTPDPFNRDVINQLILSYLQTFANFPVQKIEEAWNGYYAKLTDGRTELVLQPEAGVTVINGLGGAGMTLGFGLCDQVVGKTYQP